MMGGARQGEGTAHASIYNLVRRCDMDNRTSKGRRVKCARRAPLILIQTTTYLLLVVVSGESGTNTRYMPQNQHGSSEL